MARGSFWDEFGRDRERRRRAEVARLKAEAQIRKDERRAARGTQRETAAELRAAGEAEAAERQAELDAQMAALRSVLRDVVAFPVPTIAALRAHAPLPVSEDAEQEPPRWTDFAPPERGPFARFGQGRAVATARARFDEAYAAFDRHRAAARDRFAQQVDATRVDHEHRVDALVDAAYRGDPDAPPELAAAVLATVDPLADLVHNGRGVYQPAGRELTIEVELPAPEVVPQDRAHRYVVSRREIVPVPRKPAERAALYADLIGQITLAVLATCFRAFPDEIVNTLSVNGHISATDPATGQAAHPCLVTVTAARSTFDDLRLDSPELDARRCVRFLGAEISDHPFALQPVRPFVDVDLLLRYRLVTAPRALAEIDHRADLMQMDPHDFEKLVAALFRAKGYDAWHTQASRDDGIDAVAVKADPYVPTECLVQVKRVRGVVPPKDVQALMGAMTEHPTATNGLLVTTSRFSDRTRQRARAQGIATMEGAELGLEIKEHLGLDVVNSAQVR